MKPLQAPVPRMSDQARSDVEDHCFSTTTEEVGGFLIGTIDDSATNIRAALRAKGAKASQVSMTFTHESWDAALSEVDQKHPGQTIVGWYHSHPGFGLFMSGHDGFIQQNFFPAAGQVALVVDPVEGSMGWFSYDGSDIVEINRTNTLRGAISKASSNATEHPPRRLGAPVLALVALMAAVGMLIGWLLGARQSSQTVAELDQQVKELSSQPQTPAPDTNAVPPEPSPTTQPEATFVVYTVQPGDTLTRIAVSVAGDVESLNDIIEANPGIDADELAIGQRIKVPVKVR